MTWGSGLALGEFCLLSVTWGGQYGGFLSPALAWGGLALGGFLLSVTWGGQYGGFLSPALAWGGLALGGFLLSVTWGGQCGGFLSPTGIERKKRRRGEERGGY